MYVFIYVILSYRIYYLNIALFAIRNTIFLYRFDNTTNQLYIKDRYLSIPR